MNDKIRVLHIGGNLRINGISAFIVTLIEKLDNTKFEINVVNSAEDEGFYKKYIESFGGKIYSIFTKGTGMSRALGQAKKLKKILMEEGPFDVLHSHYFSMNGLFLRIAKQANVPIRISHCHQSNPNITIQKRIATLISRYLIKKYATHKLACSNTARSFLYGNLPSQVIYSPINYEKFDLDVIDREKMCNKYGLNPKKKYLLHIGRFADQKNHLFLIDVFRKIIAKNSSIDLILVGHGPLKDEIISLIEGLNLTQNVHFLPPDTYLPEVYKIASCFVLPSLWEGLGTVLIEAQAMGLRCFISQHITSEANLGLCDFLPLNSDLWVEHISKYLMENRIELPKYDERFDSRTLATKFTKIYSNYYMERLCDAAKELSLGSVNYKNDRVKSVEFYRRAHDLGCSRGTFGYALAYFEGNGIQRDRNKAQELVKPIIDDVYEKATRGDPKYQVIYGDMHSFGLGKLNNFTEAIIWYQKAANQNNTEALCDLGYCYLVGQGVEKNFKLSSKYWLKSAKLGYAHSCRDIGQNYLKGIGCKKSPKKAVYWFRKASKFNYSHGTSDLAYCYLNGIGVKKDIELAKTYFQKALEQDYDRGIRAILAANLNQNKFLNENIIEIIDSGTFTANGNDGINNGTFFINNQIRIIDAKSFYNSTKLEKILVDTDNPIFRSIDGILFDKDIKTLLKFPIGRNIDTYQIPDSVIEIGDYAFQNSRYIKEIIFNGKIERIGNASFDDCKLLESIEFDLSLKSIGDWAFHGCDKINQFKIGLKVEKIGKYAFGSCESLLSIEVEQKNPFFSSIEGNLYDKKGHTLLQYSIGKTDKEWQVPDSVNKVAFRAVSDAFKLEKIIMPNVKIVEEKAFYYDINLKEVCFLNFKPSYLGTQIFDNTHKDLKIILNDKLLLE